MSRSTRKPTLWTLRKVSNQISLSMPRRLTRTDTFRLLWFFCFRNNYSYTYIPLRRKVYLIMKVTGNGIIPLQAISVWGIPDHESYRDCYNTTASYICFGVYLIMKVTGSVIIPMQTISALGYT